MSKSNTCPLLRDSNMCLLVMLENQINKTFVLEAEFMANNPLVVRVDCIADTGLGRMNVF